MSKELKARVEDPESAENKLKELGAEPAGESLHEYVYFKQPAGRVVKLTAADGATRKTMLEATDGKWDIVADNVVDNPEAVRAELAEQFGIKRELRNHRRFFNLGGESVSINQIEDVGDFLIIESEAPSAELLDKLGIDRGAIITDSFDNL